MTTDTPKRPSALRSRAWFDNPDNIDMTALYLERYLNFGLSLDELRSGKPIIGIAQTGSDLSPCNRHHLVLAERVREGVREAGGIVLEFPVHPIQETGKRPTAALDRNLAYLGLVEVLYGYPLDGVVLTIGCDKTTPACLMAAATVNIPAIALNGGPMYRFTPAISFQIDCADQAEVDRYWEALTAGGEPGRCGWLTDRFGLSSQVNPREMNRYLGGSDSAGAARAQQAMMQMGKLIVEDLRRAYEGE